jgi:hypothetical protein
VAIACSRGPDERRAKLVFGLLNLLAAVLSVLQTYIAFPERAQKAKDSGEEFGKLFGQMLDAQDRIEVPIERRAPLSMTGLFRGGSTQSDQGVSRAELQALYSRYEELKDARPPVSQWAQRQARRELEEKARRR